MPLYVVRMCGARICVRWPNRRASLACAVQRKANAERYMRALASQARITRMRSSEYGRRQALYACVGLTGARHLHAQFRVRQTPGAMGVREPQRRASFACAIQRRADAQCLFIIHDPWGTTKYVSWPSRRTQVMSHLREGRLKPSTLSPVAGAGRVLVGKLA